MPNNQELESCNLGYAKSCPRLPNQRSCDAVRFGVARDSETRTFVHFVFETAHAPAAHGSLEYDRLMGRWISFHPDPHIQKMAECFVQSYLERKGR